MAGVGFEAVIFDVDGVLVDSPHEAAWRESLEALMATEWRELLPRTRYSPERFTSAFYQAVLAGKPRERGARDALARFGVPEAEARASRYAERKQAALERRIEAGQVAAFPDGVRFLLAVKGSGLPIAAASSSRNARALLRGLRLGAGGASLLDAFDQDLCGRVVAHGKPHPEIFLAAARALGKPAARCLVVEDAPAGVRAAKAGGMTALGIARRGDEALLLAAGADRVVSSLDAIAVDGLASGRLEVRAAA